jgi:hypothetical protein
VADLIANGCLLLRRAATRCNRAKAHTTVTTLLLVLQSVQLPQSITHGAMQENPAQCDGACTPISYSGWEIGVEVDQHPPKPYAAVGFVVGIQLQGDAADWALASPPLD